MIVKLVNQIFGTTCRADFSCCSPKLQSRPLHATRYSQTPTYQLSACTSLAPSLRVVSACCLLDEGASIESQRSYLLDYALESKVLQAAGKDMIPIPKDMDGWEEAGQFVGEHLGCHDMQNLAPSEKERIFQYYLPVYYWALKQMEEHKASNKTTPMVLGISAPQGCGKTTLVDMLEKLMQRAGKRVASVSIDDFYLRNADQRAVSAANSDNPMLQCRGNAGTHDLELGQSTLKSLSTLKDGEVMQVPRYDKSAFNGKGDRADMSTWPQVSGPLDIILLEGWMLGFKSIGAENVCGIDPSLCAIDKALEDYSSWDAFVDSWLIVKVGDPTWVFKWRLQAEEAMRTKLGTGMTPDEVADFVNRYIPAYTAYLPGLYGDGPLNSVPSRVLTFAIDMNRSPIGSV